jgi:hypothetical protein
MTGNPLRRILLALTCASAALLAACGSGTIVDPFQPTRVLSVGDSFSDLGQDGKRYTVNDDTINIWSQQLAADFGLPWWRRTRAVFPMPAVTRWCRARPATASRRRSPSCCPRTRCSRATWC